MLLSAALVGCKQDIGERCEQGSDCSSGYCNYSTASMMTNAQGRVCTGALPPFMSVDASTGGMTSPDAADASNASNGDASGDVMTPSSDAHGDVSTPDTITPPTDGPGDATESDQGG